MGAYALFVERVAAGEIRRHVADDDQRHAGPARDRDRAVRALVGHEAADGQQEVLGHGAERNARDVDAVGDDREPAAEHAVLGLADADALEPGIARAVVVVERFLDVGVRHHARAGRAVREIGRRRRPVRVEDVELGRPARYASAALRTSCSCSRYDVESGSSEAARGTTAWRRAPVGVRESPEAKSVTSCPRSTRPRVSRSIAISVPPWERGGIGKADRRDLRDLHRKETAPALARSSKYSATAGTRDGRVTAGERVADLGHRPLPVGEIEGLVGEDFAVFAAGQGALREVGAGRWVPAGRRSSRSSRRSGDRRSSPRAPGRADPTWAAAEAWPPADARRRRRRRARSTARAARASRASRRPAAIASRAARAGSGPGAAPRASDALLDLRARDGEQGLGLGVGKGRERPGDSRAHVGDAAELRRVEVLGQVLVGVDRDVGLVVEVDHRDARSSPPRRPRGRCPSRARARRRRRARAIPEARRSRRRRRRRALRVAQATPPGPRRTRPRRSD